MLSFGFTLNYEYYKYFSHFLMEITIKEKMTSLYLKRSKIGETLHFDLALKAYTLSPFY